MYCIQTNFRELLTLLWYSSCMTSASAPRLELKTGTSLVMTQALQQSIKLLQMNALEIRSYVDTQLEQNPFLSVDEPSIEADEHDHEPASGEEDDRAVADAAPEAADEAFLPEEWQESEQPSAAGEVETSYAITARDSYGEALERDDQPARDISLKAYLTQQFDLQVGDVLLRRLASHLIDLVDESGYITEDIEGLAKQLGADRSHLYHTLAILQKCEPAGICARNLAECLGLQLRERDRLDPAMQALLDRLPLLAGGHLEALQRQCGVDLDDLREMIAEIRSLNPKPGLSFNHEVVEVAEPDIRVIREASGKWHVELITSSLPRVLVNRRYHAKVSVRADSNDKKYITEKINEASWLVKALDQRAHTVLKVASELVAQQESFFRMGIHHLKPLTLKDIAKETGFHESTISRVTTGKYMMTPRGMFELKYFFTSGLSHGAGGDDVSSQTVKHVIKELIEKETPIKALSDDDIAERLKTQNIHVARRTVAKYREAMHIPSSTQRRRMGRMG